MIGNDENKKEDFFDKLLELDPLKCNLLQLFGFSNYCSPKTYNRNKS